MVMATKNYLEAVNDVLIRLREDEVTAVTDTRYSKLIGKFVNDALRQVEDAYNWNALTETLTVTTANQVFNYILTGIGQRFRVLDVINEETDTFLKLETTGRMNELFLNMGSAKAGAPDRYNFNGVNVNGDTQVDLYPIPNGVYNIYFNVIKPTEGLSASADPILVPSEPVIFLAYSKALVERGEDSGVTSNEAYQLYLQSLSDHIAAEANRYPDEITWTAY
jgi:hypothetical protein